jgi:hypothetical protein
MGSLESELHHLLLIELGIVDFRKVKPISLEHILSLIQNFRHLQHHGEQISIVFEEA